MFQAGFADCTTTGKSADSWQHQRRMLITGHRRNFVHKGLVIPAPRALGPASLVSSQIWAESQARIGSTRGCGCGFPLCSLCRLRLHLSLRPPLLQQPRQFSPRSGTHAATFPLGSRRPWRTAYSAASSRADGFKCRNSLVDAFALRTKFPKNPVSVHDSPLGRAS
jgi:hypothetical protein